MPRRIEATTTFDEIENEVLFTISALEADPDAQDLRGLTEGWLARIDEARKRDRDARREVMTTDARRIIANKRLDTACEAFGDDLHRAVEKDRTATRWTQFFPVAVSRFIRQALERQASTVQAWLDKSTDPVLETHRPTLARWTKAATDAVLATRGTALVRGQAWQVREEVAEELTRERDGLHDALSARSREKRLPRDWPDQFFRVESRKASSDLVEEPVQPPTPADPTPTPPADPTPAPR